MWTEILAFLSAVKQPYLGGCPKDLKFQPDIHFKQLDGLWFEHSRYPNYIQDTNRCTHVKVDADSDTRMGFVLHAMIVNPSNGRVLYTSFYGGADLPTIPADRYISGSQQAIISFHEFQVLSTDYTNYTIVYSCYELDKLPLFHTRLVWIVTRERKPSNETLQAVYNILTENNLSADLLVKTDQDNCDESLVH